MSHTCRHIPEAAQLSAPSERRSSRERKHNTSPQRRHNGQQGRVPYGSHYLSQLLAS